MRSPSPTVLLLDGDYDNTLVIARELSADLDATVVGVGTTRYSRLLRSRYCDVGRVGPPPDDPRYEDAILDVLERHRPDIVLPVGYASMAALQRVRSAIRDDVALCVPSRSSFRAAVDKATTLGRARRVGLETPADYSDRVADLEADGRPDVGDVLPFPVFLKARRENGRATTAPVTDPDAFWETYDRLAAASPAGDVLVQEYVDGPGTTYGCGVFRRDGEVELAVAHEELRSVPRHGGSGTRLRLSGEESVCRQSRRLLEALEWRGVALVEFTRRADGSFVLMEVNPKFWASYALASRFGYRFASTLVADELDLDVDRPIGTPASTGEMVFPLRELQFALANRDRASVRDLLSTLSRSDADWDVDRTDLGAWLTPPVSVLRSLPTVESGAASTDRSPASDRRRDRERRAGGEAPTGEPPRGDAPVTTPREE